MGSGVYLIKAVWASGLLYFRDLAGNSLLKLAAGASEFTGAVTGNVTGNVTGDLTGAVRGVVEAAAASAAIAIDKSKTIYITKAGVAALTLVDPTATTHDGIRLTFMSASANAHTLDNSAGSGFNGGGAGADVGTFGAAVGNMIEVEAYQGVWYVLNNVNVTLG